MRKLGIAGGLAGALLFASAALANWTGKDANGNVITFSNGADCRSVVCVPASQPVDQYGNAFGTSVNPFFMGPVQDQRPATGAPITTQDTGSSTASGQSGASVITGTPSNNSVASASINGQAIGRVQISGIWTGTLQFEGSLDGATFYPQPARVVGTSFTGSSATANGMFLVDTSGLSILRVRATGAMTGAAAVTFTFANNPGVVQVANPVRLFDNGSGQQATVKPASTSAAASDPSLVSNESPNSQLSQAAGTTSDTAYTGSGSSSMVAALKGLYQVITSTLTAQEVGTGSFATAQVTITAGASAAPIVAARGGVHGTGRKTVCFKNLTGSAQVFYGNSSSVTPSSGDFLPASAGAGQCMDTQAGIWAVVASGNPNQTVTVTETY